MSLPSHSTDYLLALLLACGTAWGQTAPPLRTVAPKAGERTWKVLGF